MKTILTHENCDIVWSSGDTRNKRFLFNNPVRFAGDAVAAVAAVNRHIAEEACRLIEVDYETLPFVLDQEEALKPGAPEIQPGGNLSPNNQGKREPESNIRGNIEEGLRRPITFSRTNTAASTSTTRRWRSARRSRTGKATS